MVNKIKKNISNFPFGKNTSSPEYYFTQDIYGDGSGITGRKKKNKKKFVSKQKKVIKNILQLSNKKNALNKGV